MKSIFHIMILFTAITLTFCESGSTSPESGNPFSDAATPGTSVNVSIGNTNFNMIYANNLDSIIIPTGTDDSTTAIITKKFFLSQQEVTFELWSTVYTWATGDTNMNGTIDSDETAGAYIISRPGIKGNDGSSGKSANHPVTTISWRDAIVWCNALTEYYNANNGNNSDLDCVYYTDYSYQIPLRTSTNSGTVSAISGSEDKPYIKSVIHYNTNIEYCTARGFRLPTSGEWEYCARYRGSDSTNTTAGYNNPYFTKGNSASGATTSYNDASGVSPNFTGRVANDLVAVYRYYWDGSGLVDKGTSSTEETGSLGANALGIYDMSGNIREWCFTFNGSDYMTKGGSWNGGVALLQAGYYWNYPPYNATDNIGFRVMINQ